MREPNIEKTIVVTRASVVTRIGSILNMMAKARFDGTNSRYVNHIVPKTDFPQERGLIDDIFKDSVGRLAKRIKCYVTSAKIIPPAEPTERDTTYCELHLSFPYNWASQMEDVIEDKINEYLAYQMIALWFEKTSPADVVYYEPKAKDLLHEVRHTCEMRNRKIHTFRDLTE